MNNFDHLTLVIELVNLLTDEKSCNDWGKKYHLKQHIFVR